MRLRRRTLLQLGILCVAANVQMLPKVYAAPLYSLVFNNEQIGGPSSPDQFSDWLTSMKSWRTQELAQINYDGSNYALSQLQWAQKSFVQPQMMIEESIRLALMGRH